jgi:hypothetical protein
MFVGVEIEKEAYFEILGCVSLSFSFQWAVDKENMAASKIEHDAHWKSANEGKLQIWREEE